MGVGPPGYVFREEDSFARAKAELGLDDREFDDHYVAIQDSIGPDPFQAPWSVPSSVFPDYRVAVSDATMYSPNALRVIYTVKGQVISMVHVQRR